MSGCAVCGVASTPSSMRDGATRVDSRCCNVCGRGCQGCLNDEQLSVFIEWLVVEVGVARLDVVRRVKCLVARICGCCCG